MISLSRKEILELQSKVEALETANKALSADLKKLSNELASLPKRDPTEPLACLEIAADTYQEIGKLWMTGAVPEEFFEQYTQAGTDGIAVAVQDRNGELIRGFYYSRDALTDLSEKLRACSEWLYCLHASLRSELCGGR